jgi:hypothetical protein
VLLIGAIAVALGAVATFAIPSPLRALAPGLFGLVCENRVCVDDARRLAEAQALLQRARADVTPKLGAPRSTAETFGGKTILPAPLEAWRAQYERRLGGERDAALWAKVEALYSTDEARIEWKR